VSGHAGVTDAAGSPPALTPRAVLTRSLPMNQLPPFEVYGRRINGCQSMRRRIGTYHHRDPDRVFEQAQEVAAWHRHGKFPAGDYPVFECIGYPPGSSWVSVHLDGGVITSASFPSLFGGVRIGSDRGPEEIGRPFDHYITLDSFGVAEANPERFTFIPGIEIRQIGDYSDGRPMRRAFDAATGKAIGR